MWNLGNGHYESAYCPECHKEKDDFKQTCNGKIFNTAWEKDSP